MKKIIISCICVIIIILVMFQFAFFSKFNSEILEQININFLTEIMGVAFTFLLVDEILKRNEKNSKSNFVKKIIKNELKSVLNNISIIFITFVTKTPPQMTEENDSFEKLLNDILQNIDKYVHSNFIRNNISVLIPAFKDGEITGANKSYNYQEYCIIFKETTKNSINNFIIKYIVKLPDDIIMNLSTINNIVLSPIFSTAMEHGIPLDVSNAEFNPEDFKKPLRQYGSCLLELYKYI